MQKAIVLHFIRYQFGVVLLAQVTRAMMEVRGHTRQLRWHFGAGLSLTRFIFRGSNPCE